MNQPVLQNIIDELLIAGFIGNGYETKSHANYPDVYIDCQQTGYKTYRPKLERSSPAISRTNNGESSFLESMIIH